MTAFRQLLADFSRWPANLVRDFPQRAGRLLGALAAPPQRLSARSLGIWLHGLGCYLFDLAGGPEMAETGLRLLTDSRPLTAAERATAAGVFGPRAIRFDQVRVAQGGILERAFRLNGGRAFATWHTINLPSRPEKDLSLIVHELTHVYQYERVGTVYIGQGLWVQRQKGHAAYHYGGAAGLAECLTSGLHLHDFNREQQGQIAQDYCRRLSRGEDVSAYEPFIAELRAGIL
ncbi:MAG: eCIS core domain-containing protein [Candidatus Promineifilaceae bacterium]